MSIYDRMELYERMKILDKLFPYGCDKTMAMIILHEVSVDPSIFPFNLSEEEITETGYYMILDRLSFKIHELTEKEIEIVEEFCLSILGV